MVEKASLSLSDYRLPSPAYRLLNRIIIHEDLQLARLDVHVLAGVQSQLLKPLARQLRLDQVARVGPLQLQPHDRTDRVHVADDRLDGRAAIAMTLDIDVVGAHVA